MQGGHMGSRVVASLLALNLGAGPMLIGVLIAAYSIFQLAFALVVGRISDRYGSRRPMLGGTIAFGCGLIIPAVSPTLPGAVHFSTADRHRVSCFSMLPRRIWPAH